MGLIGRTTKAAQEPTRIEFAAKVTATTKGSLPHNGTLCGGKGRGEGRETARAVH